MKVRINRNEYMASCWYRDLIGEVLNVEDCNENEYKIVGSDLRISKYHAEVVEDVEKNCESCRYDDDNQSYPEICYPCRKVTNGNTNWMAKYKIAGVGAESPIVTNIKGAKQSKIDTAFSLVPHDSLLVVAKVMKIGSERYEKDNWRKLSTDEIYDHLMEHLVNWHMTGNMEDLEHGITRAMMLYSVANDE